MSQEKQKIIKQGAEAVLIKKDNQIIKRRIRKSYRIPQLDEKIRKRRTKSEGKLIEKASELIPIPEIIKIDEKTKEISMKFIKGKLLSENLNELPFAKQKQLCKEIGKNTGRLHKKNIIHGDLTTSNIILSDPKKEIYFIDFGLGFISHKLEDKAVDLHLLKQAFQANHYENWEELFEEIKKGYSAENKEEAEKIFQRIKAVEKRGRYKH